MKFNRSIQKTARYCTTRRSSKRDCGLLHTDYSGGDILLDQAEAPPLKGVVLRMPIPRLPGDNFGQRSGSSGGSSGGIYETSTEVAPAFTGYAPGILLADSDFDYNSWDNMDKWVEMVKNRRLRADADQFVQVKIGSRDWEESYGVSIYYAEWDYVENPKRWERLAAGEQKFSKLVFSPEKKFLRAREAFRLHLPSAGRYILIAHFGKIDEAPPSSIIDPDEYNKMDSWSFLPLEC